MQTIIDIIKGIVIGMANVIPGVSGGTLAISFGIYDVLIDSVNKFLVSPLNSIKMVWKYALGMLIGVVFAVFIVSYLFEIIPVMSSMFFIGLIIGTIPKTLQKIHKENISSKDMPSKANVLSRRINRVKSNLEETYGIFYEIHNTGDYREISATYKDNQ